MKENRQTKKGDRKQTKALPPFSSPPQLCANSGDTGATCKYTKLHQSPRIERELQSFSLSSLSYKISPLPHFVGLLSSCRPLPVNIGLKHLILCWQKASSSLQYSHPALPWHCATRHCARPKSWAKRRLLSPQQIRTLKKCPFVLLMHFFSPHLLLPVLRHPHLHFLKQPASVWLGSNHHKCKPTFHFN